MPTTHRFAGIELIDDRIPDETSILVLRTCSRSTGRFSNSLKPFKCTLVPGYSDLTGHDFRYHLYRRPQLHQEQRVEAGSCDASDQRGQPVVFRHESGVLVSAFLRSQQLDRFQKVLLPLMPRISSGNCNMYLFPLEAHLCVRINFRYGVPHGSRT